MKITLSPQMRGNTPITLEKQGDTLIVNSEAFDFSFLSEGDTLPRDAVTAGWLASDVTLVHGDLVMSNINTSMVITAAQAEAATQTDLRAAVTEERDRRLNAGAVVAVTDYGNVAVQGRPTDQINLIALGDTARDLQAEGYTAAGIEFRDGNNTIHNLTAVQMIEVVRKGKMSASGLYAAAWALKDAATIPADFADDRHWP